MNKGFTIAPLVGLIATVLFSCHTQAQVQPQAKVQVQAQKNTVPQTATDAALAKSVNLDSLMLNEAQRSLLVRTRQRIQARAKNPELFFADPSLSDLETPTIAPLLNASMAINGVVLRSNNRSMVWINGEPFSGSTDNTPVKTLARLSGLPAVPPAVASQLAKVGETIELPSGERHDLLPAGSIIIVKPPLGSAQNLKKE